MSPRIAVVGMACVYPDAATPEALFENVLAQRRSFRRIPPERIRLSDYRSTGPEDADAITAREAALIEGWTFDRLAFRVAARTYETADLAHWLALDVAARALIDAGCPAGEGLPREGVGVIVGNTLTGEFSRAAALRLRWPYARRVLDASLEGEGWTDARRESFLTSVEQRFKAPFPPPGDESLAGGLSNTIAGRVCNHFDFGGGGFTVDGACSASLLAVAQACSALEAGDLDVALAGGVDLSLDPFELVGFARIGAIATGDMRIYDASPSGFLPGEGCGFVVLMREDEAQRRGLRPRVVIRGWGISSDGSGGLTRPEARGQTLALRRAYRRAGFGIETVPLFEGHGTGTAVGDEVELISLFSLLREGDRSAQPAVLGSVKANIGHTKAAAGIAGFLKAAKSVETGILPPISGCEVPHALFLKSAAHLRVLRRGEEWPTSAARRAGVTALGFGGINVHVVVEAHPDGLRVNPASRFTPCQRSAQDAELIVIGAPDRRSLLERVRDLRRIAGTASRSEVADLARTQAEELERRELRGSVVASSPDQLEKNLEQLLGWLASGATEGSDPSSGVFLGSGRVAAPRIVFLFPGQAAPSHLDGGLWRRRFPEVESLYNMARLPEAGDGVATEVAQPAIVTASLAGLKVLRDLGIEACAAIGHSLGELSALCWAGVIGDEAALRIARSRGQAMAETSLGPGSMAQIAASAVEAARLLAGTSVVIAGLNGARSTVISGPKAEVERVVALAGKQGLDAALLRVSHAFHSPLVAPAAKALQIALRNELFQPSQQRIISTITGRPVRDGEDPRELLVEQVTAPVRFHEALQHVIADTDLYIEVGPGSILRGLCVAANRAPVISLDAGGESLRGLLLAVGASFALGAPVEPARLFRGRFTRPFAIVRAPMFFRNPCEMAPVGTGRAAEENASGTQTPRKKLGEQQGDRTDPGMGVPLSFGSGADSAPHEIGEVIDLLRRLVSERAELPIEAVTSATRLLQDFHLNSITVGALVGAAAQALGTTPPFAPTEFARASVGEIAKALLEMAKTGAAQTPPAVSAEPPGLDSWVGSFDPVLVESPSPIGGDGRNLKLEVFGPTDHPLVVPLRRSLGTTDVPQGVAVCLPPGSGDDFTPALLIEAAKALLGKQQPALFLVVQQGGGGGAFARTFQLETGIPTCVVDLPFDDPRAMERIGREAAAAEGFAEVVFDHQGRRQVPLLRARERRSVDRARLGPGDVLLVTGGGKGIAAECALRMGEKFGTRLVLMGRSHPSDDPELDRNLKRFAARGLSFHYLAADVTDGAAVRDGLSGIQAAFGRITAILHGAGKNEPCLIRHLDAAGIRAALLPKVDGFRNIVSAVDPNALRLLIGFGSIIARTGLPGEAAYGLANEWLTRELERFAADHPRCRVLPVEWSVWSGTGMGERLGRIEALARQGISAITPDQGVEVLLDLIEHDTGPGAVVVTSRLGQLATATFEKPELPVLRFLEKPLVHYPGQELVVEAGLSVDTDLYLRDHQFGGMPVLPAVIGLEALAQVASCLLGKSSPPVFERVEIPAPIVVPEGTIRKLRLLAVRRGVDAVDVAIRSDESGFQADHLRARCRFSSPESLGTQRPTGPQTLLPLDPSTQIYGPILFHRGRFARVKGYTTLTARTCAAVLGPPGDAPWFSPFLPRMFRLGDPSARDAAIHAIQACIPHATVLPVGAEQWQTGVLPAAPDLSILAWERSDHGDTLVYDVDVTASDGAVLERIRGLVLKVVARPGPNPSWPPELWAVYLERRARDLSPGSGLRLAVERTSAEERSSNDVLASRLTGTRASLMKRPDGRPEIAGSPDLAFSSSRADGLLLAVTGFSPVACDVEIVTNRSAETWAALLGAEHHRLAIFLAERRGEPISVAATRVWTAVECLKKAGRPAGAPMTIERLESDGWVVLSAGALRLVSYAGRQGEPSRGVAFCFLQPA